MQMMRTVRTIIGFTASAMPFAALAQPVIVADSGDSAWVLTASLLALLAMLCGLGLFYGGRVHARNILSVLMQCIVAMCVVSLIWTAAGYSFTFGEGSVWLGGLGNLGLANLAEIRADTTISEAVFALFQMTFAIVTSVLLIGAFAERARFGWVVAFSGLWSLLVYVPVARWMWGGGWLAELGALDFAGGIVVHTTAGIAAIVIALFFGRRRSGAIRGLPHSRALSIAGAGLLWVGQLGLNGGSSLAAGADAAGAILNTHLAVCAAALVWIAIEKIKLGTTTSAGLVTGAVAGMASIAPASGFVGPMGAILLGCVSGVTVFTAAHLVQRSRRIDDPLSVFAVHGVSGIMGSLLFPLFVPPVFGGPGFDEGVTVSSQFVAQSVAVGVTILWTAALTTIIALMVTMIYPLRVTEQDERDGLDQSSHGERGWNFD